MTPLGFRLRWRRGGFSLDAALELPLGITALVGPSGCGKSSLLRLLAGLERPADGFIHQGERIWFDAARGVCLAPQRRRVGLVFQDYALFDHLTVAENVAFGVPRPARRAQVRHWLRRLGLEDLAGRRPHQLSGGQRQRVALARALAPEPDLLLLDEPFSALDGHRRAGLREGLAALVEESPRPVLLVTHDLEDARRLAQWTAVMVDGRLLRHGPTGEVFHDPGSATAARVLGWRNLLPLTDLRGGRARGSWGTVPVPGSAPAGVVPWLALRPERLRPARPGESGLRARVRHIHETGAVRILMAVLEDGSTVEMHRPWDTPLPAPGETITILVPPGAALPLPAWPSGEEGRLSVSSRP